MTNAEQYIQKCEGKVSRQFTAIDAIAYKNQIKVLDAFRKHNLALRHFAPTTGYGYDDVGRDTLCAVFADIFRAEKAIVSPLISSGTHALTLMLFGILRPGDTVLSVTGEVYDTLQGVIGETGTGSLKDFGINFEKIDLKNDMPDIDSITKKVLSLQPKMVFIQRSRGYNWRNALSVSQIESICKTVKSACKNTIIGVDNCYGEFVDIVEPTEVGADICAGSMIKNPGGGIAPTGGYVVGKANYVDLVGYRLTAPGVGMEVGSYAADYRSFYQGLFFAPHVTAQACKGAVLFSAAFSDLGYKTLPSSTQIPLDIICSICFEKEDALIDFCRTIQEVSPVDSHVVPYPWNMPGYDHQVIMAAGTFVQGASIELSADSPIKTPYIAYLQGGLTYEHVRYAAVQCINKYLKGFPTNK